MLFPDAIMSREKARHRGLHRGERDAAGRHGQLEEIERLARVAVGHAGDPLERRGLEEEELVAMMRRALTSPAGLAGKVEVDADALHLLAARAGGDARRALTSLEVASQYAAGREVARDGGRVDRRAAEEALQQRTLLYDKSGEEHYNVVSAFIKSMRGSDVDAALYWMARMLEAGEDPLFVVRRMVIFASEDVGNADPRAISVAVAVKDAVDFIGMPEAWIPLAQAATYLATAPKSNASYVAMNEAREDVRTKPHEGVPLHLRNAPTGLMKELGYGSGYEYAHDKAGGVPGHGHLPEGLKDRVYYRPKEAGYEANIRKWMEERARRRTK